MHAIVYDATEAVVGVVRDAMIDGQRITGSNMSMVTSAPYLLVETDPGEIANISELTEAAVLAGAKAAKKQEIAAARWNEMSSPTTVSGYDAVWYTDKESLDDMNRASINLQRAIALGHKPENTMIEWKTANGTFINLSLNDLITVELLLSQRQQELYTKESLLKNQIEASSTVNEVELLHW